MGDLEERLRSTVVRRSDAFVPSADLPDRIDARVRHHRRRRRLVTGGLAAMAAAAAVTVVVMAMPGGEEGSVRTADQDHPDMNEPELSSTTTAPTTTSGDATSTTSASTTTTSGPPEVPTTPDLSALNRRGVGPITAGMTLRQAETAAEVPITVSYTGSTCLEAQIEGTQMSGLTLVVEPPAPGADPMDGIVRAAGGSVLPTEEGVIVGQTRDEVVGILGQPTRTEDKSVELGPGSAELLVFEAGGYAYGVTVVDGLVYDVHSGDPSWIGDIDGCPGSGPG
jgi:hypothetical protein